ncbi:MAG: exosortase K [Deltaproteobacteria bacterium]|nr:exosortase K [Deltaproteobacteria bacterium]
MKRTQVAALAMAALVVIAGKEFYRTATAADLRWILAPTAHVASWLGFGHFTFDASLGYVDRDLGFAIAPPCAGLHFALAAFVALVIGWLGAMGSWRATLKHLAAAAALAYLATFVINTVRILIAIRMHRMDLVDREELHRLEGIVIYLGGLCALYALARRHHAVARS